MTDAKGECQRLSARFWRCLDERNYDGLVEMFGPEGVWHRQGKALKGAEQILAAMAERTDAAHIRHVLTATDATQIDDKTIDVWGYIVVFRQKIEPGQKPPYAMPKAASTLMSAVDRYTLVDGAWKILEKKYQRIFVTE